MVTRANLRAPKDILIVEKSQVSRTTEALLLCLKLLFLFYVVVYAVGQRLPSPQGAAMFALIATFFVIFLEFKV